MEEKAKQNHKSKIGGQALIEGIMMKGVKKSAMAVRLPDGTIDLETWDTEKPNAKCKKLRKIPFVRGIFNMVDNLIEGYRCMMKSAEKAGFEDEEEEELSKFEQWLNDKCGEKLTTYVIYTAGVLGVLLAIVLFMLLPALVVWGVDQLLPLGGFKGLIEGLLKIAVFVVYLALISQMKDIRRVFEYHGAEHKTIACFEAGEELTVENVKKYTRFHPRCGTSFMILVLIIGILIFSVVTWSNPLIRTLLKLVLLPVVVGIAYELIKLAGRYDNILTRIISYPGLKLQHFTTREPAADQIEIAIAAVTPVLPENLEEDRW